MYTPWKKFLLNGEEMDKVLLKVQEKYTTSTITCNILTKRREPENDRVASSKHFQSQTPVTYSCRISTPAYAVIMRSSFQVLAYFCQTMPLHSIGDGQLRGDKIIYISRCFSTPFLCRFLLSSNDTSQHLVDDFAASLAYAPKAFHPRGI